MLPGLPENAIKFNKHEIVTDGEVFHLSPYVYLSMRSKIRFWYVQMPLIMKINDVKKSESMVCLFPTGMSAGRYENLKGLV